MDLSLRISQKICPMSFCSLRTNRTVVRKRTLKKNIKQKSDVQMKADSDKNSDSDTIIVNPPPKNKNIVCILLLH